MFQGHRVAVVVPAHNEALLIGRVIDTMPDWVDVVVVVDDASTDATAAVVSAKDDVRVRLVRHVRNKGVGAAIATGYVEAMGQADVVAVMAGDGQMDPADLEAVIEPVVSQRASYCKGVRTWHPRRAEMPILRRWGTQGLAWLTGKALRIERLADSQCGYTAIASRVVGELDLQGLWPRFGYPNDLLGQLRQRGIAIAQVPVRPVYATERSELRARHGAVILWLIARAAYRVRYRSVRGGSSFER